MDSFTLHLTDAQMAETVTKATAQGVTLSPEGGNLPVSHGVHSSYAVARMDGANMVTVTVSQKPFYISISAIEDAMRKMLGV